MKMNWAPIINQVLSKYMKSSCNKKVIYRDIILQKHIKQDRRIKFAQMKIGLIWQSLLGHLPGVQDLGVGDASSLDLKFTNDQGQKYIIELKNSYNTDNASSRARNIQKLARYAETHTDYIPIYGIINSKIPTGQDKVVTFENMQVRMLTGPLFFKFIFQNIDYEPVIESLANQIEPYLKDMIE